MELVKEQEKFFRCRCRTRSALNTIVNGFTRSYRWLKIKNRPHRYTSKSILLPRGSPASHWEHPIAGIGCHNFWLKQVYGDRTTITRKQGQLTSRNTEVTDPDLLSSEISSNGPFVTLATARSLGGHWEETNSRRIAYARTTALLPVWGWKIACATDRARSRADDCRSTGGGGCPIEDEDRVHEVGRR